MITRRRFVALPALLGAACARAAPPDPASLRIVASFSILADLLENVGGPVAGTALRIDTLVGADSDAHLFEPRPDDARSLSRADLVVVNGLGFEGWMDRLVRASGSKAPMVVATAGLTPRRFGGQADPHAWQTLDNAKAYVRNLTRALGDARPALAPDWQSSATAYSAKIDALDRRVRARFDAIPRARRRVMTSHDAFGYFGAAYGIDFIAPLGMSTDGEPSAATVARLVRQIREQDIRAVFVENITDPRLVERIAREAGVAPGGRLYSDALSRPGTEADTYLKLFAHNASVIAAALEAAA